MWRVELPPSSFRTQLSKFGRLHEDYALLGSILRRKPKRSSSFTIVSNEGFPAGAMDWYKASRVMPNSRAISTQHSRMMISFPVSL